jgi:transcriptional regulator with XRE-family HTH domain
LKKSKYTPLYEAFRAKLAGMRKAAHLTQRQLAAKLKCPRTIVERIEMGERRVDVVELYWLCKALTVDPMNAFPEIVKALLAADREERIASKHGRRSGRTALKAHRRPHKKK